MTTKTKMSNLESYRELSLQITTLDMKLNKVLELLNKPEVTIDNIKITGAQPGHGTSFIGAMDCLNCDKITPHCIEGKSCECADKFKESLKVAQLTDEEWNEEYK